jgi:hypothetical protein
MVFPPSVLGNILTVHEPTWTVVSTTEILDSNGFIHDSVIQLPADAPRLRPA